MRRAFLVLALCLAAPASASAAGTPARSATRPRSVATAPAKRSVPHAAGTKAPRDSARTLEAVHIEGELDVPEVLFITARDQRRIVEFQHRRYLPTTAERLRDTPPTRLVVARGTAPVVAPAPPATPPSATGDPR